MFKRIHSERDPADTLWKELNKEFGKYFGRAGVAIAEKMQRYPWAVFSAMIVLLVFSGLLSFTVFRNSGSGSASGTAAPGQKRSQVKSHHPLDEGFSRILETGEALKQTLGLKRKVEGLLAKGRLSPTDSVVLDGALDSLRLLQGQLRRDR